MTLPVSPTQSSPPLCDYEGTDYRADFWTGHGRDYEDLAERIALTRLLPNRGECLIDIGGGFGRLLPLYAGHRKIVLMDPSKSQLCQAREAHGDSRITYVAANLYGMPFLPGSFDTAVMVRVLHHLPDVSGAFSAIHRILSPKASFILEFANQRNLKAILRYALRRQAHNPFSFEPYEFAPLHFDFQPAYVQRHLLEAGFQIGQYLGVSQFRISLLKRIIPAPVLARLDGWLQVPAGHLRLTPSVFVSARASDSLPQGTSLSIFCCPSCHSADLSTEPDSLRCGGCGRRWSTTDGIYDFRQPLT